MLARLHPAIRWFGGSALLLAVLVAALPRRGGDALIVQCAASQRGPLAEIAAAFEAETGCPVELRFGASETLLANLAVTGQGDVFLPADETYIDAARERGLVGEATPIARMKAVLIVPAGNPRDVRAWNDLFEKRLTIAQANPDAAAIGRITRERLKTDGRWSALDARTVVEKGNVSDIANDVALRAVDAGIVWDVVGKMNPRLAVISLPELAGVEARVAVTVVNASPRRRLAQEFVEFLVGPKRGGACFQRHGFELDHSTERPAPGGERR